MKEFFLPILMVYLILINAAGLVLMLVDKRKARRKAWRIPEATLLTWAVLGGSIGSLMGMYLFRHKTRHLKFTLGVPLILAIQIVLGIYLVMNF